MTQIFTSLFILISAFFFAQHREMAEALQANKPEKALDIGQKLLQTEPDSFETNFLFAKAFNDKLDFKSAKIYTDKAQGLAKEDWQKSWILVEALQTSYGLGNVAEAKATYEKARQVPGTKNSESELRSWGILFGFDDLYADWKIVETENITFHFPPTLSEEKTSSLVASRQQAFEEINVFFEATLPKKIDFFVWDQQSNFNLHLRNKLGFTNPAFCISHNKLNQSPGHEIAHNISHWRKNNAVKTRFINEGIGVYFDQNKNDKVRSAQEVSLSARFSVKNLWTAESDAPESLLYPVAGAFVEYLIQYDKEKFLELAENQTYENAKKIYGEKLDKLIDDFTKKLNP